MQNLYNVTKYLLSPAAWIFIGLTIGCLISVTTRSPRSVRFILCFLLVLYYGLTTRPLTQALLQPLETYYAEASTIPPQSDAIVLFVNESLQLHALTERPTIIGTTNADLLVCGLPYVRAQRAPKIVLAEGIPGFYARGALSTTALQEWAVHLGYPQEPIVTANQGVGTHERAAAIKQLLGPSNRILLIDTAAHLPRSTAAFRKAGFIVTPIACDAYNMSTIPWGFFDFLPYAKNLEASTEALHEYLGLITYWLRGLI